MRTFQDSAGRTWTVAVTVDAVKRVRDLIKEDLLDIEQMFPRLLADPILLCDCLYCVCKPQADAERISDEDFARTMAGDVIARAKQALIEELIDFFPETSQRETLRLAVARYGELSRKTTELIKQRLGSPALAREIEAALASIGDSFTDSPASSESTPDH
jgi:hypothetical protein